MLCFCKSPSAKVQKNIFANFLNGNGNVIHPFCVSFMFEMDVSGRLFKLKIETFRHNITSIILLLNNTKYCKFCY